LDDRESIKDHADKFGLSMSEFLRQVGRGISKSTRKSNKVIVDKTLQDQIGYVNEWIEANPKEGKGLVEYVSKMRSKE